jgi:recombination protein RecR
LDKISEKLKMSEQILEKLIKKVSRLPGLGPRSSRRVVLHLLKNKEKYLLPLINDLSQVADNIKSCIECGNLDQDEVCEICKNPLRKNNLICVVETVADLWALERTQVYEGKYHILGGVLSAIDGINPEQLNINSLESRLKKQNCTEVIIAISATLDGQTTAHYIADRLNTFNIKITRLAHGVPIGGELDFLDDGTIAQALKARNEM